MGSGLGAAGQGQQDFSDLKLNPHLCEDRAGILVISRRKKDVTSGIQCEYQMIYLY